MIKGTYRYWRLFDGHARVVGFKREITPGGRKRKIVEFSRTPNSDFNGTEIKYCDAVFMRKNTNDTDQE